jgi:hypothetical protein
MPEVSTNPAFVEYAHRIQEGMNQVSKHMEVPLPEGLVPMRDILPEGRSGNVVVNHYEVTELGALVHNLNHIENGSPQMCISTGRYVRLYVGKELMMSDAPYEAQSNRDLIEGARGKVLIAGLGMGMVLVPILRNPKVSVVTVVEKSKHVIKLVKEPLLKNGPFTENEKMKLVVVQGDINSFTPKANSYDFIYFDIWPTISSRNLPEIDSLKRRFKKSLCKGGEMKVWVEDLIRQRKKDEKSLSSDLKKWHRYVKAAKSPEYRAARKQEVFTKLTTKYPAAVSEAMNRRVKDT